MLYSREFVGGRISSTQGARPSALPEDHTEHRTHVLRHLES